MRLKISCITERGFTSYGTQEGRRKAPVYTDTAWVVFDPKKRTAQSIRFSYYNEECILGKFSTEKDCQDFIRRIEGGPGELLTASRALLDRLDNLTSEEFSRGGERAQRESLRAIVELTERAGLL